MEISKKTIDFLVVSSLSMIAVLFAVMSFFNPEKKIYMLLMLSLLSIQNFYQWNKNKKDINDKFAKFQLGTGIFISVVVIVLAINIYMR